MSSFYNHWKLNIQLFRNNSFLEYMTRNNPSNYWQNAKALDEKNTETKEKIWHILLEEQSIQATYKNRCPDYGQPLFWLIELLFYIPNIIFFPIIYTILDIYTRKPISSQERNNLVARLETVKKDNPELFDTIIHGLYNDKMFRSVNSKKLSLDLHRTEFEMKHATIPARLEGLYNQMMSKNESLTIDRFLEEFEFCYSIVKTTQPDDDTYFLLLSESDTSTDDPLYVKILRKYEKDLKGDLDEQALTLINQFAEATSDEIQNLRDLYIEKKSVYQGIMLSIDLDNGRCKRLGKEWSSRISLISTDYDKASLRDRQFEIIQEYILNDDNNGTKVMQYLQTNLSEKMTDIKQRASIIKSRLPNKKPTHGQDLSKCADEKSLQNELFFDKSCRNKSWPNAFESIYCQPITELTVKR